MGELNISENKKANDQKIIERLLAAQQKDFELREKEAESRNLSIASNERIALASIKAQAESEKYQANIFSQDIKYHFLIILSVAVTLCVFGIVAIVWDKEEIAKELAKIIGYGICGYFAGLGKAKIDQSRENSSKNHSDE